MVEITYQIFVCRYVIDGGDNISPKWKDGDMRRVVAIYLQSDEKHFMAPAWVWGAQGVGFYLYFLSIFYVFYFYLYFLFLFYFLFP
jgi:hypothetical protein